MYVASINGKVGIKADEKIGMVFRLNLCLSL